MAKVNQPHFENSIYISGHGYATQVQQLQYSGYFICQKITIKNPLEYLCIYWYMFFNFKSISEILQATNCKYAKPGIQFHVTLTKKFIH